MLNQLLQLDRCGDTTFVTNSHQPSFRKTLFGGQVLGQGLVAAMHTVENRFPHSLHAYFLSAGTTELPVTYEVTLSRDGKSVSNRRVSVLQNDKMIFEMMCSFHSEEPGFEHQHAHPTESRAATDFNEKIPASHASVAEFVGIDPIDYVSKNGDLFDVQAKAKTQTEFWVRSKTALSEPYEHYGAMAFASDIGLLASTLLPHNTSLFAGQIMPASMDHVMWFHALPDFNQWHQYSVFSPWAGNARGLASGYLFDPKSLLVATVCQEGLIRPI